MKRIFAYMMVAVLLLAVLAGCSPAEKKQLRGSWKGHADLAVAYETMLAGADPGMTGHIDIQNFNVELTLTFEEDGTYTWTANDIQLENGTKNMMKAIADGMATYLQIQTGLSIEQLLQASGKTMDELMAEYFDPNMAQVVKKTLCSQGTYEVSDGVLTLTDEDGNEVFKGDIAVSKDTLELKNGVANELISRIVPLTLTKK